MDENRTDDWVEELPDEDLPGEDLPDEELPDELLPDAMIADEEPETPEETLDELTTEKDDQLESEEDASCDDGSGESAADDDSGSEASEDLEEETGPEDSETGETAEAETESEAGDETDDDAESGAEAESDEEAAGSEDGIENTAEGFTAYADMREYSDEEDDEDDGGLTIFDWVIRIAFGISAFMIIGSFSVIYALMSGCISLQQRHTIVEEGSVIGSEAGSEEDEDLVQTHIPRFNRVEASSHRYSWNDAYLPEHVNDFDPQTVWAEGADGIGTGEWIELQTDEPQVVVGLRIRVGYPSEGEPWRYEAFCRPADVDISLSDGTQIAFSLDDKADGFQVIEFDEPHEVTSIRLTIETVHMGESYYDTCIAEIQAY